jgi:hypothetical protein
MTDTTEPTMTVTVEVWPVAADETGLWLLGPDGPWPSPPIPADSEPHVAVELELIQHQVNLADVAVIHSTSWRTEHTSAILTYLAVVDVAGLVLDSWPDARPVTTTLADHVGRPPTHGPLDPPAPRYVDVLLHGLRHLAFLLPRDATVAAALPGVWGGHLAEFSPWIAHMYDRVHQTA